MRRHEIAASFFAFFVFWVGGYSESLLLLALDSSNETSHQNETATGLSTDCRVCQEETAPGWMAGIS